MNNRDGFQSGAALSAAFGTLCLLLAGFAGVVRADDIPSPVIRQAYAQYAPALCLVMFSQELTDPRSGETRRREGTSLGLLVRSDGLVITHGHLQTDTSRITDARVRLESGNAPGELPAVVLGKPDDLNLLFLQIQAPEGTTFPSVSFADAPLQLGDPVLVLGRMGETVDYAPGVTLDYVASVVDTPRVAYCLGGGLKMGFLSGPVVNARGEVVGVTGLELSEEEGGGLYSRSGVPMVFQSSLLTPYIATPPRTGNGEPRPAGEEAWLGVFTQPLKPEFAAYWGLSEAGGLIVSTVVPDSPAAQVGIRPGDIIKSFDGKPQRATQDREVLNFSRLVRDTGPGKTVRIELLRDGQPLSLDVTLAARPQSAQDAEEYEEDVLGLTVRELTRDIRIALNIAEDVQGVIVRRVASGSPAQAAKMRPGVIVMSVGDHTVTSIEEYRQAIEQLRATRPAEVPLFARLGSATGFFRVRPRW
ncbi:MAG TPA: PDZ domain-containing protein [Candidatus Hydrogenedentes bacterium]|mgnify:CR=1 FL=1|nr:PDZ domain-containing protein [Candidatus Hydrogenedentota bacterium]